MVVGAREPVRMVQYPLTAFWTELWKRVGDRLGSASFSATQIWCVFSASTSAEAKTLASSLAGRPLASTA